MLEPQKNIPLLVRIYQSENKPDIERSTRMSKEDVRNMIADITIRAAEEFRHDSKRKRVESSTKEETPPVIRNILDLMGQLEEAKIAKTAETERANSAEKAKVVETGRANYAQLGKAMETARANRAEQAMTAEVERANTAEKMVAAGKEKLEEVTAKKNVLKERVASLEIELSKAKKAVAYYRRLMQRGLDHNCSDDESTEDDSSEEEPSEIYNLFH